MADLPTRLVQHRRSEGAAFVSRYGRKQLVHAEVLPDMATAIAREKGLKAW